MDTAPRELAERLGGALSARLGASLERFEVAGPGFLNLFVSDAWLTRALAHALAAGERFGVGAAPGAANGCSWNSSRLTPPARCTSATRATPPTGTRSRACSRSQGHEVDASST